MSEHGIFCGATIRTGLARLLSLAGMAFPLAGFAACAWADQPGDLRTAPALLLTRQGNMIVGRLTGGVAGYSDPGSPNQTIAKLMKAGASVSLIEMGEPLWFGHYYTGKNACSSSIENVAERTAGIVKIYTAAFPNVIVGDGEPFPAVSSQPNWAAD